MKPGRRIWLKKVGLGIAGMVFAQMKIFSLSKNTINQKMDGRTNHEKRADDQLKLGAFSISLNVKDINASKTFYENLGFVVFAGSLPQKYFIMKNGNSLIGLFQGMFTGNILTFNPGWDENGHKLESFDDIRKIQSHVKDKGIKLITEVDENTTGPASFLVTDPDGNSILFDQHV